MALPKRHASGKAYKDATHRVERQDSRQPESEVPPHRSAAPRAPRRQRIRRVRNQIDALLCAGISGTLEARARARLHAWRQTKLAMRWLHERGHLRDETVSEADLAAMAVAHVQNVVD